ncbi:uncharacterized protein LOC6732496 isoform X2 [Drosophila simulans]|uniref:GD21925 n=1 Tax=Drosophila simulans TaxID=7240 RepID=B4Q6Z3_DROSI|nr:uncharacterized protein LOC6732496 isoform X2 [Drosophila simulans]EDX05201.1 GD21925 [Drosophila simulans]KMY90488.1 uncharacterized protein Dsimw501_GD21925, isoform A [Drosophila simulans]KMY90489.1 uncharacterized protein Dsimw501_GD21925, isoform B [Drosophila simulans]
MGFRIVLLAATGLGAMYMMHLLAQDWVKIRPIRGITQLAGMAAQPIQQVIAPIQQASGALNLFRSRREASLNHELGWVRRTQDSGGGGRGGGADHRPPPAVDWKRILSRDPFECLQSLICQLMSGAEAKVPEAELLMDYLESSLELAPAKIGRAFSRGLALRGSTELCYNEYPFCLYSAKTMLRILRWFSESGESLPVDNVA